MFPTKMIYQPTAQDTPIDVLVYDFQSEYDMSCNIVFTLVVAWSVTSKMWITAPISCFRPLELTEG